MRRFSMMIAALAVAAAAQAESPANTELEPMAFLAGTCWQGEFPDGNATDTHCFDWVFGGQHLRDTHVVKGKGEPYRGETLYSWDAENQRIAFRYVNSLGGYSDGHFEQQGDLLIAPERYVGEQGEIIEMRSTLERAGDGYVARTWRKHGDEWREEWTVHFERVPNSG